MSFTAVKDVHHFLRPRVLERHLTERECIPERKPSCGRTRSRPPDGSPHPLGAERGPHAGRRVPQTPAGPPRRGLPPPAGATGGGHGLAARPPHGPHPSGTPSPAACTALSGRPSWPFLPRPPPVPRSPSPSSPPTCTCCLKSSWGPKRRKHPQDHPTCIIRFLTVQSGVMRRARE